MKPSKEINLQIRTFNKDDEKWSVEMPEVKSEPLFTILFEAWSLDGKLNV